MEEALVAAKKYNARVYKTSAKNGTGINEMFKDIASKLLVNEIANENLQSAVNLQRLEYE